MTCSVEGCDREVFNRVILDSEKCILHCEKPVDSSHYENFLPERDAFSQAILEYVENSIYNAEGEVKFIHFRSIYFPRPDYKGENYLNVLDNIQEIHFDSCHFYSRYLKLKGKLFFQDCKFHDKWNLQNYEILDNVLYQNCIFYEAVSYGAKEEDQGKTIDNEILKPQFDYSCKFKNSITINNAVIEQNIFNENQDNFVENNFSQSLEFNKCQFEHPQELYLKNNENLDILLTSCHFKEKFKIRSTEDEDYKSQQKNKAKLNSLKIIDCTIDDNAYLRIGFLKVYTFELKNLRNPQNTEINIGDCYFTNFQLTNFRNLGKFKLFKVNIFDNEGEKPKSFQIDNTSIGDADFQSINLSSFERVKLFDNILSTVDYTNINWGKFGDAKDIEVEQDGDDKKQKLIKEQDNDKKSQKLIKEQDTYRILKNVASRNNDQPQALKFYAKEMQKHREYVKANKCIIHGDRVTLAFNSWTNNFGLSWWKPFLILLILTPLFYWLLLCSLGIPIFVLDHWQQITNFLNPTHRVEFIAEGSWSGLTYFLDLFFRGVEGLFIYQIIQAFRKYSRKL